MRNIGVLIKHNLNLMIWKKKSKFLIGIVMPIFIILIISKFLFATGNGIKVGIVNMDNTDVANYIVTTLKSDKNIVPMDLTEDTLKSNFADNSIQCAIVINKGFEKSLIDGKLNDIEIVGRDGDSSYKLLKEMVNSNLNNIEKLAGASKGNTATFNKMLEEYKNNNVKITGSSTTNLQLEYEKSKLFLGFLFMFIFFKAISGAERVNEDKREGIFQRILLGDTSVGSYYFANMMSTVIMLGIQVILSIVLVKKMNGIEFGMPLWMIILISMLFVFVAVSIGTFSITVTKDSQEASMLGNIIAMALLMLGGCFVPVSIFPSFMDKISNLMPTRWLMNMITNIQTGSTLMSQWKIVCMAVLFVIAFILISSTIVRLKDKKYSN